MTVWMLIAIIAIIGGIITLVIALCQMPHDDDDERNE